MIELWPSDGTVLGLTAGCRPKGTGWRTNL